MVNISRRAALGIMGAAATLPFGSRAQPIASTGVDWPSFLARHDLMWDRLPRAWDEGPFLGNGMIGAMLYFDPDADAMRLDLGYSEFQDHKVPMRASGFDRARLPIGHFLLRTAGRVTDQTSLRLVLHDATMVGEIVTERGKIGLRGYVHAVDMAFVIDLRPDAGEAGALWEWVGAETISPRQTWGLANKDPQRTDPHYVANPPGVLTQDGEEALWLQPLLVGGGAATAWHQADGRLIGSIASTFPDDGAKAEALGTVRRLKQDAERDRRHTDWWHAFYPASFLSVSDTRMESFYWIQIYKLASATRSDRALVDDQGPWLQPTAWPYATWNLNVQLIYWPAIASNHSDLVGSLARALHDHTDQLIANVDPRYRADSATIGRATGSDLDAPLPPPQQSAAAKLVDGLTAGASGGPPELGNLPWALHDLWLVWRHTLDDHLLRETLFPLLRRTTNYYRHFLTEGPDGKLHLPPSYSPEYGAAPDCNYDLALLRWSCGALIEAAQRLKIDDPLVPEWHRIGETLVDYPQDSTGFMIGAGLPLSTSHRHYSHLLMAYPLYLVNREQPGASELIKRTVDHWQSMPAELRGYSATGASSLSAALGDGESALHYLQQLYDYVRPNTLYKESGPVIETPLSGAQSILDMILQSWGGVVRPFPAMPASWRECVFSSLSAEGAFLVGARRQNGVTQWVTVRSGAGEPLVVATDIVDPVATVAGQPRPLTRTAEGHISCALAQGETLLLHPMGINPVLTLEPAPADVVNSFGLNARSTLKTQRDLKL